MDEDIELFEKEDIFGSIALVSKRFHTLTMDPSILKFLHIEIISNKTKSKALYRKVVKRFRKLVELKISDESEHLNWNDLKLISNLPQLKTLTINANHLNHINRMNFANLTNLVLDRKIGLSLPCDYIMKELAKLPFPTLETISFSPGRRLSHGALMEKSIEKLVMNIPSLTCFYIDSSLNSGINHEFILRMFTENHVVLLLDTYLTFDSPDQQTLEKFIEKRAGILVLEEYRRIKKNFVQWRLKLEEIHPMERKIKRIPKTMKENSAK